MRNWTTSAAAGASSSDLAVTFVMKGGTVVRRP